ncbi:MAG TPA: hypothetical protein VGJ69_05020 [Pyrinomonadaceae bacterium]
MAGYSGTPLVKKLGIKEGFNIAFINEPEGFEMELELPKAVTVNSKSRKPLDFVLLFVQSKRELEKMFLRCAAKLTPAGMLWIAWPKKASHVATDLTDNVVRNVGLMKGMVDVKVCAVDEVWSGLKFVFRLKDRPKK